MCCVSHVDESCVVRCESWFMVHVPWVMGHVSCVMCFVSCFMCHPLWVTLLVGHDKTGLLYQPKVQPMNTMLGPSAGGPGCMPTNIQTSAQLKSLK